MKSKKGMGYFVIVSLILALIIFLSYSFLTKGMVFRFLDNVGVVEDDLDESIECVVEPGTNGDEDGDGIKDDDECEGVKGDMLG